jgi:hypothetical protein
VWAYTLCEVEAEVFYEKINEEEQHNGNGEVWTQLEKDAVHTELS